MLSPADGASDAATLPIFTWIAHPDASEYTLIVKRNGNPKLKATFAAADICADGVCTVDSASLPDVRALKLGKNYAWRVKANTGNKVVKSAVVGFSTADTTSAILTTQLQAGLLANQNMPASTNGQVLFVAEDNLNDYLLLCNPVIIYDCTIVLTSSNTPTVGQLVFFEAAWLWTPSGNRIVLTGYFHGTFTNFYIWSIKLDGTDRQQITVTSSQTPSEIRSSPDGTKIAYILSSAEVPYFIRHLHH
ncbi:MAG: hypothetical protein H7Y11_09120 [Armatimonadetes bacterium]|nr:hypothetical protein [Anaerolineae bacterium]